MFEFLLLYKYVSRFFFCIFSYMLTPVFKPFTNSTGRSNFVVLSNLKKINIRDRAFFC